MPHPVAPERQGAEQEVQASAGAMSVRRQPAWPWVVVSSTAGTERVGAAHVWGIKAGGQRDEAGRLSGDRWSGGACQEPDDQLYTTSGAGHGPEAGR